jgi:hypothetical protein
MAVMVYISGIYDFDTLAKYLEMIGAASPKAIGVDVFFEKCNCTNASHLVEVLSSLNNLTVINYLDSAINWNQFKHRKIPFPNCSALKSGYSKEAKLGFPFSETTDLLLTQSSGGGKGGVVSFPLLSDTTQTDNDLH